MSAEGFVKSEFPLSEVTAKIIAAATEVHRNIGPGFREVIYQRALELELQARGLSYSREAPMEIHYRGVLIGRQRVDFFIEDVMVEIKAHYDLQNAHFIQALSYLKASGLKVGLLLNFGAPRLQIKRLAN